jgi:hypothetical protein
MRKRYVTISLIVLAVVISAVLIITWAVPQSIFLSGLCEYLVPRLIPSSCYVSNLQPDNVNGYGYLDAVKTVFVDGK